MSFSAIFAKPVYILVFWLLIITLGFMGYAGVPRDLFPDSTPPQVAIVTSWRGTAAEDMNRLVTTVLDREIKGITGLKKVTATSKDEISSLNAEFQFEKNLGEAVNDVTTAISRARRQLPVGIDEPQVFRITEANRPLLTLAFRAKYPDTLDLVGVRQIVDNDLKEEILRLAGVGRVDVFGAHEPEIAIRLDHHRLREYDLTPESVLALISATNVSTPGGYQETPTGEILIRTVQESDSPRQLGDLPIRIAQGGVIRLSDIATVSLAPKTPRSLYHGDGETAIALNILKPEGGNSLEGIISVKRFLAGLPERYPQLTFSITTDQQPIIDKNFAGMNDSLISAIWLTMLIVFVMLAEWRTALIIGISIPLAFLTTLAFLFFSDYTLNMVTLTGLIISVGMVVDASIVVVENVMRLRQAGKSGSTAVFEGVREVAFSVFGGTLTTIVVLVPLMFTGGYVQRTMRPLSVTISMTLIGSFLAAFTIVPVLLQWLFGKEAAGQPESGNPADQGWFERLVWPMKVGVTFLLDSIGEGYLFLLKLALKARFLVIIGVIAAFGFTVKSTIPLVGMELMPRMDTGLLTIRLDFAPHLTHGECGILLSRVEAILKREAEVLHISSVLGSEPGQMSFGAGGQLLQQAEIQVWLTTRDLRERTIWHLMGIWREQIAPLPGVLSASIAEFGATPVSTTRAPLDVMLIGRDWKVLDRLAGDVLTRLAAIPGLRDLRRQWSLTKPEAIFRPNLPVLTQAGLSPRRTGEFLQLLFSGRIVSRLKLEGFLDLPIRADLGLDGLPWSGPLERLFVLLPGFDLDLGLLGTFERRNAPTLLTRENLEQTLSILGINVDRPASAVAADVQAVLNSHPLPPGYSLKLAGTPADMAEANDRRGVAIKRGLIFLFLALILMFETLWHPLLVMASIPLAMIWGLWGLVIFDKPMCLPALSGFILLGGTIVNNAIILIDFIEQARREGMEKRQALFESVRIRLRPIFITTFSTVLGLLPLTLEQAVGLERLSPLGVVATCGLTGGTLMTLVIIPLLYDSITDLGTWLKQCFAAVMALFFSPRGLAALLVLSLGVPCSLQAEPITSTGRTLTVQECLEAALSHSPLLDSLEAERRLSEGLRQEAAAGRHPQLESAGSLRHWDTRRVGMLGIAPGVRQFYDTDLSEFRLTLRQLLWDSGQTRLRTTAATLNLRSREAQLTRVQAEITAEVYATAIGVFTAEALATAAEKTLEDIRSTLEKMAAMEEVGRVPHVDVLRIQARVQEVLETREVIRQSRTTLLSRLASVIGSAEPLRAISPTGLPELSSGMATDTERLVIEAIEQRSDLAALRLAEEGSGKATQAQRHALSPQVFLNATVNRYGDRTGWGQNMGFVGLEMQWSIADGGRTRGRVRQAEALRSGHQAKIRQAELKVAEQVRVAGANLQSAQVRWQHSQATLALAEEAFRIERVKYEQGKGTVNDILDSESALFQARSQVIRAKNEALAAQIALDLSRR